MKKVSIILLALILTLLCANLSMAAGDQSVTVNPFGLLFGQLNGISGLAGFKWLFDQGFTVEAGAGVNMVFGNVEGYNGLGPALALSLGYTW
mgnify:CR=1 FL=1|jgi:hypothetical protein